MAVLIPPNTGVVARYRADTVTDGGSGGASLWPDLSGNGYDLAQASAALRPAIIADAGSSFSNKPVLRLDGINDLMSRATTPAQGQPFHVFVICKVSAEGSNDAAVVSDENAQVTFGRGITNDVPTIQSTTYRQGSVAWPLSEAVVAEGLFNGGSSKVGVNFVQSAVASPGGSGLSGLMIGNWGGGGGTPNNRPFSGDIAEILIYNHVLTHAERVQLARYARQRYGIPLPFPQTSAPTETSFAIASTTHQVAMPASVEAGELLLVQIMVGGAVSIALPTGWTERWHESNGAFRYAGYAKVADGTEGGTAVNFATSAAATAAAQCYKISLWSGTLDGVAVGAVGYPSGLPGAQDNPNPPALTPGWGALSTLWLALAGWVDDDAAVSSYSASYVGGADTVSGAGANAGAAVGSARRELAAASENPGPFTLTSDEAWAAQTVAIRPIAEPPAETSRGASAVLAGL